VSKPGLPVGLGFDTGSFLALLNQRWVGSFLALLDQRWVGSFLALLDRRLALVVETEADQDR
jgi:hypothetical protein